MLWAHVSPCDSREAAWHVLWHRWWHRILQEPFHLSAQRDGWGCGLREPIGNQIGSFGKRSLRFRTFLNPHSRTPPGTRGFSQRQNLSDHLESFRNPLTTRAALSHLGLPWDEVSPACMFVENKADSFRGWGKTVKPVQISHALTKKVGSWFKWLVSWDMLWG